MKRKKSRFGKMRILFILAVLIFVLGVFFKFTGKVTNEIPSSVQDTGFRVSIIVLVVAIISIILVTYFMKSIKKKNELLRKQLDD
ncbi:Uncharacterised protein [uncultured archaeon]|nr:Uncharacterised protein [uncultured archaeon]